MGESDPLGDQSGKIVMEEVLENFALNPSGDRGWEVNGKLAQWASTRSVPCPDLSQGVSHFVPLDVVMTSDPIQCC